GGRGAWLVHAGVSPSGIQLRRQHIDDKSGDTRHHHAGLLWFLYLDESGDLGFDFFTKHPSHFLTVCILAVQGVVANVPFEVYAMTLNKRRVYDELAQRKDRVYHFIARQVLDRIPVEDATTRVELIIDRSK